ncbi:hypothetical protein MIN45_P0898 [Methylomarinovum tepidoasis]|uniref:Tetratricopeptide repeat protein n=1 Tax=Methylomarinovum tepidoasis TaxID=2840183 RepID=A0AAU9CWJ3_9GAMM|nr:tetratricopeptide repeat protein [Methylomarinovum sp. IN45]BCX88529.1 hypothetical protein MIN45_P0898 [Methylomarinovum sp. IN45]
MKRALILALMLGLSACSLDPLFMPGPAVQPQPGYPVPPAPPAPQARKPAAPPPAAAAPPPPVHAEAPPPAVVALVEQARQDRRRGDLERAAGRLERALRIQPDDARLWYELAVVRLEQGQPRLAEELAKKSLQLARGDIELQQRDWRLIAEARRRSRDAIGAREAERRAAGY